MTAVFSSAWVRLQEGFAQSLSLTSPFCPWYLIPAAGLCVFWLMQTQAWSPAQVLGYARRVSWQNRRHLLIDGLWAVFQIGFLRAPVALLHLALFQWSYDTLLNAGGERFEFWQGPQAVEALLATVVTMLAIDFAAYLMHRALHSSSALWWIHRIHHQARFLSPLSTLRQHPLEPFLLNGARGLAAGLSLGALHLLFPNCTPVWTIGGMGVGFFLYMFTVNLHHAPIPLRYPMILRCILISPHIHHIHHSRNEAHFGRNFGVVFSIWDRMFGTYLDQDVGLEELEFGLGM
jgi:sterol desaturase/sphingolipid hydroxylase (fatty acid hydroxylase superfamily)